MEAAQILASRPSQLFKGSQAEIKSQFTKLAMVWHPDHCKRPDAEDVFQHILKCRDAALRGEEGLQRVIFTRTRPQADQKPKFALDYVHQLPIECGTVFVSYENISYLVAPEQESLTAPALNMRWAFPDKKMEQEMTKYLPRRNRFEHTTQGTLMVYKRNSDQLLLSDLLAWEKSQGRTIDYRHVMWMISSLLNTCCYLEIQKTAHCALLPHYLLVSPDMHSVALVGPPLYATPFGTRPKAVPQAVLNMFPRLRTPGTLIEDSRLDLTLVRALARQALGVTNPALLARDTLLPEGLRKWLSSPAPKSALKDYKAWEEARGKRAFTPYGTTASEIYVALAA